jgi:uncharacterized protein (TIGR00255 family)
MIRSMTAFASEGYQSAWGTMTWELRSFNHRYLESIIRLPEPLRCLEASVRERVSKTLSRGKVECVLRFQSAPETLAALSLNRVLVEHLLAIVAELEQITGPGTGLQLADVLHWPGVVTEAEPNVEQLESSILACLDKALAELVTSREREGERITAMIQQRCYSMRERVRQVRARRPAVLAGWREKLLARLATLPLEPDFNRLEQELVIVAQRLDVEEELDRLDAHLDEINAVLQRPESVGRRLDFLMQELHREANTLSAKASDTETTRATVELKVLIEQMREQVQNIE